MVNIRFTVFFTFHRYLIIYTTKVEWTLNSFYVHFQPLSMKPVGSSVEMVMECSWNYFVSFSRHKINNVC